MENLAKSRLKNKPSTRSKHNYAYLLASILILILLAYLFFNTSPNQPLTIKFLQIPTKPLFLIGVFGLLYTFFTFLLIRKIQGVLVASLATLYLLLRFIGLTHWLFLILFAALFITLELFILKKK